MHVHVCVSAPADQRKRKITQLHCSLTLHTSYLYFVFTWFFFSLTFDVTEAPTLKHPHTHTCTDLHPPQSAHPTHTNAFWVQSSASKHLIIPLQVALAVQVGSAVMCVSSCMLRQKNVSSAARPPTTVANCQNNKGVVIVRTMTDRQLWNALVPPELNSCCCWTHTHTADKTPQLM